MSLDLSIVVAVYNEDPGNLRLLVDRISSVIGSQGLLYEIIFVNDGSLSQTSKALRELACNIDTVKLIELSRNFGQQAAITAGLEHAEGRAVVNLDSDLQDPPDLIPEMVTKWREGYDVVYVQRSTRRDRFEKRFSANVFYRLLAAISSVNIPRDTGDFRLVDRRVVRALHALPEKTRFLRGLIPWLGFKQIGIPIDRDARAAGKSAYTIRKLVSLALDGLTSFSVVPLLAVPIVGVAVFLAGIALSIMASFHCFVNSLLYGFVSLLAGVQIICTGCVAIYTSKILEEARGRPTYIVAERLGLGFSRTSEKTESAASLQLISGAPTKI